MTTYRKALVEQPDRADTIYTEALFRMFGLVALGVVVTAVAIWVGDAFILGKHIFGNGWVGVLLYVGATLGVLIASHIVANKGMLGLATALYLGFAALEGFFISPILELATGESMAIAFILVAALFVLMAAIGLRTKRDLSGMGSMLFFTLFGAVVVLLLDLFIFQSGSVQIIISIILFPVFLGLTVWETRRMKIRAQEAALEGDAASADKVAVQAAIGLYLNVLNLFLIVYDWLPF
ncbi:MAG: Bax inhibitor-1/YccA family protein [Chloroflexi bacterium]|nr:Bax inhibitor-1/YccA family protein [Chloroflexota bacterium]